MIDGQTTRGSLASEGSVTRRAAAVLGIAAAYAVGIWLLWHAREIILIAFAGILLAVFLNALAGWLSAHSPIPYGWSVALVVIAILVLLGLLGWLLEQRLTSELQQFQKRIPTSWEQVRTQLQKSNWGQWLLNRLPEWKTVRDQLLSFSRMNWALNTVLGAIAGALIVLFVGLYGAAQPGLYRGGWLRLVAPAKRERGRQLLDALAYNLRWWIIGQLISMTCVGVLVGLGMWLLGVPLPLSLAVIAFALEFIPNIGPILAAIPAVLLAWGHGGFTLALWALLVYLAIQLLESYVITPVVYEKAVRLPPAVSLLAIALFGLLAGLLGVFVAAPLTVALMVLVKMLYVEDALGDPSIAVPGEQH